MSETYEEILKRQWKNVPKVKVLPTGTWRLKGKNVTFQTPNEEGKNPSFMFVYVPVNPTDDVDEGLLAELGAEYNTDINTIFFKLWYETSTDLDKLRAHLNKHGIETPEDGVLGDAIKQFKGSQVMAYLDTKTFVAKSGESVTSNDPKNFAPVAD